MPDTVDPASAPPRTLAQIIEDGRGAVCGLYRFKREPEPDVHIPAGGRHRGGVTGAPGKLEQAQGQWRVRLDGCLGERVCRSASAAAQRPHAALAGALPSGCVSCSGAGVCAAAQSGAACCAAREPGAQRRTRLTTTRPPGRPPSGRPAHLAGLAVRAPAPEA